MQSKEDIKNIIDLLKIASLKEKEGNSVRLDGLGCKTLYKYIEQLETEKQELIEKLEEGIEITKKQYSENTLLNIRVDGKLDTLEEILKILKGEKDE